MAPSPASPGRVRRERGAATVEFALVSVAFFALMLGIIEFGRVLFTWNSAAEATRHGARVAVVCDVGSAAVLGSMRRIMPALAAEQVTVSYLPSGCAVHNCTRVRVGVTGITLTPMIPLTDLSLPIPPFATTLPRESLSSTAGPDALDANPMCA